MQGRDAGHLHGEQRQAARVRARRVVGRRLAEERCEGMLSVGDDEPPGTQTRALGPSSEALVGASEAYAERAIEGVGVKRPHGHGGVDQADCEDVGQQSFGEEPPSSIRSSTAASIGVLVTSGSSPM